MISRIRGPAIAAVFALFAVAPAAVWADGASNGPTTFSIGVDHTTLPNHNFEYVDYFPRSGVKVHTGDVLDFGWAFTPDGLHTATLLQTGETLAQALQKFPLVVGDPDDSASQLQFNPQILAPSNPACGGSAASPCSFDGSADLNSGAFPTDGTSHFFTRIDAPAGTQLTFICLIHPGMVGTATVVSTNQQASQPQDLLQQARIQGVADTAGALMAEAQAVRTSVQQNPDGTRTITMTAGTATPFVEVAEMLPNKLVIKAGDTVTWVTRTIKDPHTVTFPSGNGPGEPLPMFCEAPVADVPFTPPTTGPPCGNPALLEVHFEPAPGGSTVISTPATFGTSGVISNPPAPFPHSYSFQFPNAGTFAYQCRIHDHMVGTIFST
jgi:plastocyanin